MSDAAHRDSVSSKTFKSSAELLEYCKKIQSGWFRCQAIAIGAEQLDKPERDTALRHAIKAAETESDTYRQLTPQIWVVRCMQAAGDHTAADRLAEDLLNASGRITPSNSQAYMLELLFGRSPTKASKLHKDIFRKLVALRESKGGWRTDRACIHTAESLATIGEADFVDKCLETCTSPWLLARVHRDRVRLTSNP